MLGQQDYRAKAKRPQQVQSYSSLELGGEIGSTIAEADKIQVQAL